MQNNLAEKAGQALMPGKLYSRHQLIEVVSNVIRPITPYHRQSSQSKVRFLENWKEDTNERFRPFPMNQ
ncbi:MAG: hypothetical protein AB7T07_00825 [Steroidobacteraceae bacterium]